MEQMTALMNIPAGSLATESIFGIVETPKTTIGEAQRVYLEEIAADEIRGKSENQRRHWTAIKQRAVDSFVAEVGDIPIADISRDDARKFYDFWRKRVALAKGKPSHSPNSGNRDLGTLRVLFHAYHKHIGQDDIKNPFAGLGNLYSIEDGHQLAGGHGRLYVVSGDALDTADNINAAVDLMHQMKNYYGIA